MINRISRVLLVAALTCGLAAPAAAQGFAVVVNASNPTTTMSKDDASKLFLGKTTSWSHGGKVVAVDQERGAAARDAFSTAVHGKSAANVESYWLQQVFAGKAEPPAKMKDDAAVLAFVAANAGAVGYVSAGASVGSGVKKVTIN